MKIRNMLLSALLAGSALLGGCASHAYVAAYVPGPPVQAYVGGPIGYAPGPGYVWADGFWDLHGNNWVWAHGYWARPPRPNARWVSPRWVRTGHGWRRVEGRWR